MMKGNEQDCICAKIDGKHTKLCDADRLSELEKKVAAIKLTPMTPKKVSNCHKVRIILGRAGTSDYDYVCSLCSQPCNPVEAKSETLIMDPLGRVQKVSPEIKAAREVKEEEKQHPKWCDCLCHGTSADVNDSCDPHENNSPAPRPTEGWEDVLRQLVIKHGDNFGFEQVVTLTMAVNAELAKKDEEIKQARVGVIIRDAWVEQILSLIDQEDKPNPPRE